MRKEKHHGQSKKAKGKEMLKKRGRPPKKVIASFPDEKKPYVPKEEVPVLVKRCDCGEPVHGDTHQCWACSHRA